MDIINQFLNEYFFIIIIIWIFKLLITWAVIYTAVKSAIKNAIHEEIFYIKTFDPEKVKTPEDDFKEELEGWN